MLMSSTLASVVRRRGRTILQTRQGGEVRPVEQPTVEPTIEGHHALRDADPQGAGQLLAGQRRVLGRRSVGWVVSARVDGNPVVWPQQAQIPTHGGLT